MESLATVLLAGQTRSVAHFTLGVSSDTQFCIWKSSGGPDLEMGRVLAGSVLGTGQRKGNRTGTVSCSESGKIKLRLQ